MHFLLVIAFLEVAINRVAVPMLRPLKGAPPAWHTLLDYTGLFLFYFTGTLALFVALAHAFSALGDRERGARDFVAQVVFALAAFLAAVPLVIAQPANLSLALEIGFAVAVIALVVSSFSPDRDIGAQVGIAIVAVPLLVHTLAALGAQFLWPESTFDGEGVVVARVGVLTLSFAALVSPYVFAPRPFVRSVIKPTPILVALAVAGAGAAIARRFYPQLAKATTHAIGVELSRVDGDRRMAIYLLAVATLTWTLTSLAIAKSAARRQIGVGVALLVLGGYAFRWPNHYLLPLIGIALIADAAQRVRAEEIAALPISTETPPIVDSVWSSYIGNVVLSLKRVLGNVHSLTTRGDGGLVSSLIIGDKAGINVRTRIERIEGSVIALDVVLGKEIDEVRGATLCLWAIPPRALGVNPSGPPAAPLLKSGDAAFDQRFRTRGSALAFNKIFDETLRARAVATLDGWLAFWEPDGIRYRVYPGRGASLDHPMPLSDLAVGRPAPPERLVAVIELLFDIAQRGVKVGEFEVPTNLQMRALKDNDATEIEAKVISDDTDIEGEVIKE